MQRFIIIRLSQSIITLLVLSLAVFLSVHLTGDPASFLLGPDGGRAEYEQLKKNLTLAGLLHGSVVVEVVFAWPGMGRLTFDAINARDFPVILAATALAAVMVVAGNLAADLLQSWADPRVRHDD